MKTTDYQRGKKLESLSEIIRGEGESQPQSIGGEIIRPRDRATHGTGAICKNSTEACRLFFRLTLSKILDIPQYAGEFSSRQTKKFLDNLLASFLQITPRVKRYAELQGDLQKAG